MCLGHQQEAAKNFFSEENFDISRTSLKLGEKSEPHWSSLHVGFGTDTRREGEGECRNLFNP